MLYNEGEVVPELSGSSSAVERQLPKLDVAGSIPVSRSINPTSQELGCRNNQSHNQRNDRVSPPQSKAAFSKRPADKITER